MSSSCAMSTAMPVPGCLVEGGHYNSRQIYCFRFAGRARVQLHMDVCPTLSQGNTPARIMTRRQVILKRIHHVDGTKSDDDSQSRHAANRRFSHDNLRTKRLLRRQANCKHDRRENAIATPASVQARQKRHCSFENTCVLSVSLETILRHATCCLVNASPGDRVDEGHHRSVRALLLPRQR